MFQDIYSKTKGFPYSFVVEGYTYSIMSVPLGLDGNIRTITYSFNGTNTLIIYNPDDGQIGAMSDKIYLTPQEVANLLNFIHTNYEHTQSN